jgi:hypothetical protein
MNSKDNLNQNIGGEMAVSISCWIYKISEILLENGCL